MLEIRPIVVDDEGVVLGGNMRLKACQSAGLKEVFITRFDGLSDEKKKEFVIRDNVNFGEWDYMMLIGDNDIELNDWGLDLPNWDNNTNENDEYDDWLYEYEADENNNTDDKDEKVEKVSDTSILLLVLKNEDYEVLEKITPSLLEKTGTKNISDAFYKIIKNI